MVQSLGGQTRKNRAKIYGSPRFAQRDAADKEWNSRKGRTDQRLETARSKIPNDPDRFSPSNFRDKKCIHISKEGRKEGFRPVSTKIPRPCTGYPAEWIPGGIAWEVFVREKENVGIVEFGLKIIAYTKFGWINKGGLLGEREDSIYFRLPVPSRSGMIYAERVPRLHAAGEFSLSALHPAVSPGWQSVALPSLSPGPPSTSPSALRCIFLG